MESCLNIEKDIDKFENKFSLFKKQCEVNLDALINEAAQLQSEALLNPEKKDNDSVQNLTGFCKNTRSSFMKLAAQHKDLHSSVSKIGKTIDRNFDSNCGKMNVSEILVDESSHKLLNKAMCEHFYRQNLTAVAECLIEEASLVIDPKWKHSFIEINHILASLQVKNVDLALAWAMKRRHQLAEEKSQLEFKLHQLKFLSIINSGRDFQMEALQYSKNFQSFAVDHRTEVQKLMGCLLFMHQGLEKSPYAELFSEELWNDAKNTFSYDACKLMGLSVNSPLMSSFTAGCQALPTLLAIRSVIAQRQSSTILTNNDELPIDIELDSSQHYHSVFACPILKNQTTDKNPPVKLVCGHVISRDALSKLVSGAKVKCPYCPQEQSPNEAKQVFF